MAPAPKASSTTPRSASLRPSLILAKGTIGAQLDRPMPQTRNINSVARLAALILSLSSINLAVDFLQRNMILQKIAKYCKK
jgi:hypothetical protein